MDSFYVELSSNASYFNNTCAEFKNKIDLVQKLEGDWEVGIAEISYTKSWYNVRYNCTLGLEKMHKPFVPFFSLASTIGYVPVDKRIGVLRAGYYSSVSMIVNEINLELRGYDNANIDYLPKFYFDDAVTQLVSIKPGKNHDEEYILPYLSPELSEMLGFIKYDIQNTKYNQFNVILAERPADLTNGIRTMFIYSNLVMPQYIGDFRAKLLRTVEIPNNSKFGDQVVLNYDNIHYVPIMTNDFNEIEISIKDDMNENIRFTFGRTRIKLHFRKCNG